MYFSVMIKNTVMKIIFLLLATLSFTLAFAQKKERSLKTDTVPTLKLTVEERKKEEARKQKKMKKNVFYEKKCRKMFTRQGEGNRETIEVFYVLKTFEDPNPYIRDIYWYDVTKDKIFSSKMRPEDKPNAMILHGPYKKTVGGKIMEEGVFFVGAKHARWVKYDANFILIEKLKFYKGFAKEADISYFDSDRKKINEVIPKQNGIIDGDYFSYYQSGNIKATGKYKNGVKIGLYTEYYDVAYRRKIETQYAKSYLDKDFIPFKLREWDNKGTLTYDKLQEDKKRKIKVPVKLEELEKKEEAESDSLNSLDTGEIKPTTEIK